MENYGYEVTKQDFEMDNAEEGETSSKATNVISVKKADDNANGDILIVSAHHDSKPNTVGADDNASGTAMVMELARVVKDVKSDTEIRFITFSGEEEGLRGSQYYVSQLSDEEKAHIVGDIQIDMIGHYMSDGVNVKTSLEEDSYLADLVIKTAKAKAGANWGNGVEGASDHSSFTFAGIPSVLIEQDGLGAENHKYSDGIDIIDVKKVIPVADTLESIIQDIASTDTGSLVEDARGSMENTQGITIADDTFIVLGLSKIDQDVKLGTGGTLIDESHDDELGWDLKTYEVNAKWFGLEETLPTEFVYQVGENDLFLNQVYINTDSLSLSDEELGDKLTEIFGEPVTYEEDFVCWGSDNVADNLSLRQYQIDKLDGHQIINIIPVQHPQEGIDLKTFDFSDTSDSIKEGDKVEKAILDTAHKIIPKDDKYIKNIASWTDGYSYILGTCSADDMDTLDEFTIRMDRNDFYDKDGNVIDEGKLLATMVHEYGHSIMMNSGQIDVSKLEDFPDYNDISIYKEDAYTKAFYDKFYNGDERSFSEYPGDYVDDYAGGAQISEDIAESFMVFVTSNKAKGDSIAAKKVNFFYDYPELVKIRDYIRGNFGYPDK